KPVPLEPCYQLSIFLFAVNAFATCCIFVKDFSSDDRVCSCDQQIVREGSLCESHSLLLRSSLCRPRTTAAPSCLSLTLRKAWTAWASRWWFTRSANPPSGWKSAGFTR